MFQKILTVCTGNICRSPVAEYLLRHQLDTAGRTIDVQSAGIGALIDHPADDAALAFTDQLGVPMARHRARQIAQSHTRWADLILVMQKHHLDYVLDLDPTARGKTFLLGRWGGQEVPDPYQRGEGAHLAAYKLIAEEVQAWVRRV